jgi:hypothetical protein
LACRPLLVVGIPVALAIERFALVTPNARFHENVRPGPSFIKPPRANSTSPLFHALYIEDIDGLNEDLEGLQ